MPSVRFAPSPTGSFHVGNLRSAWISKRWADALGFDWILRFEDIDRARASEEALRSQLADLGRLALHSQRPHQIQSQNHASHWKFFERAVAEAKVYPCVCSRKAVQLALDSMASAPHGPAAVYSGQCRNLGRILKTVPTSVAWRFRNTMATGAEDFIVGRSASLEPSEDSFAPAYLWACAADDYDAGHELIVRAWDLKAVLVQQRSLHEMFGTWLGAKTPAAVFHCALVVANDGHRLEKRSHGVKLSELLRRGLSVPDILMAFEQSFDFRPEEFAPAKIFGEKNETISLKDLKL